MNFQFFLVALMLMSFAVIYILKRRGSKPLISVSLTFHSKLRFIFWILIVGFFVIVVFLYVTAPSFFMESIGVARFNRMVTLNDPETGKAFVMDPNLYDLFFRAQFKEFYKGLILTLYYYSDMIINGYIILILIYIVACKIIFNTDMF